MARQQIFVTAASCYRPHRTDAHIRCETKYVMDPLAVTFYKRMLYASQTYVWIGTHFDKPISCMHLQLHFTLDDHTMRYFLKLSLLTRASASNICAEQWASNLDR